MMISWIVSVSNGGTISANAEDGSFVRELQRRLGVSVDGNFGPGTLSALERRAASVVGATDEQRRLFASGVAATRASSPGTPIDAAVMRFAASNVSTSLTPPQGTTLGRVVSVDGAIRWRTPNSDTGPIASIFVPAPAPPPSQETPPVAPPPNLPMPQGMDSVPARAGISTETKVLAFSAIAIAALAGLGVYVARRQRSEENLLENRTMGSRRAIAPESPTKFLRPARG